ncbi:Omp28-related outer membrane protein [Bacteroidota bacterium]
MKKITIFIITLLLLQCETNPPTFSSDPADAARFYITSNVDSANIFINDEAQEEVTPAEVSVEPGSHQIRLEKTGYYTETVTRSIGLNETDTIYIELQEITIQKAVLLEDFANVSCTPCIISNQIIKRISDELYDENELIVVKYPTNFPSPVDPFYLANSSDCDARYSFYDPILSVPAVIIDGISRPIPTDETSIVTSIEERLNIEPPVELLVTKIIGGDSLKVDITISVETDISNLGALTLHTVITETDINFDLPPGSNGETTFYHVMRKMLPSNNGEVLDSLEQGESYNFQRSVEINPGWQTENLSAVVFLQDLGSKVVIQSAVSN